MKGTSKNANALSIASEYYLCNKIKIAGLITVLSWLFTEWLCVAFIQKRGHRSKGVAGRSGGGNM